MGHWIPFNDPTEFGLMGSISLTIASIEQKEHDFLPNLRTDSHVVVVSDYAGDQKGAKFNVYSFLLADRPGILGIWDRERRTLRQRFLKDGRRIEFKKLGDQTKQKALGPFLEAASSINGVLFCVAIDKAIKSVTSPKRLPTKSEISEFSQHPWSPRVFEKLVRVLSFGSFLVAGLCRKDQSLHWITDEDDIVANEEIQRDVCRIADRFLHHYVSQPLAEMALGIAGKFDDERRAEDLVSIVDLVGGTVSAYLSAFDQKDFPATSKVIVPVLKHMSTKSQIVFAWLCQSRRPLKKMICVLRPSEDGKMRFDFLNIQNLTGLTGGKLPLWVPPDKGWVKSIKSWK